MVAHSILASILLTILGIAGCASDGPSGPSNEEPELTFVVDPTLTPPVDSLPGFADGESRPVGCITNSDGLQAEFVSNELWLSSDDKTVIEDLITRLSAEIIADIAPADYGLSALPRQILLRFDPSTVDPDLLVRTLEDFSLDGFGEHRVSSAASLGLFASAAQAALDGLDVGINWIGQNNNIVTRDISEAPAGPSGYDPNAFTWPSHSVSSRQDIGVAEAWRGLELAGRTTNKVKLAILDQGFQINGDTPDGWVALSNVPLSPPLGVPNFIGCGKSDCNWHGTNVLSAAMAVPDDDFGNAGPAGQIAEPVIISTSYDFFTSISALLEARALGARIANMSYSAPVPIVFAWSVLPFEATTALLAESGMLLFAAAGNDGKDVDDESCFVFCVENTWWTPCENAGVICVGGLREDTPDRALGSNYGAKQVDIYAPYTVYVGPDPENPDNAVRKVSGTSFSSPFAAGVAAMIWAANPGLSANSVRGILYDTAHRSPDPDVNRYVNALGGVQAALGNVPPVITVFGDTDLTRQLNHELVLSAMVSDFEDGNNCCDIRWESNVDGFLGTGNSITHVFSSEGSRMITLSATDGLGGLGQAVIALNIVNSPPTVTVTRPTDGESILGSVPFTLRGQARDINEPNQNLACSALVWTSSNPNDAMPVTGCDVVVTFNTLGARTLTLTATDPQSLQSTQSITVNVVAPPNNLPPTVSISSPQNGINIGLFDPLTLSGSATDPEGNTPLSYEWIVNFGSGNVIVGTSPNLSWTPDNTIPVQCDKRWNIRISLRVTDSFGQTGVDFVDVRANFICK